METPQEFYTGNGPMTAVGAGAAELSALPRDLAQLCKVIQGVLIHSDIAPWLYDLKLSAEKQLEKHTRAVGDTLARIKAVDERPLTVERDPRHRVPSVCRHFSTMLSAILRAQGIPAHARCGFGAY